jgi:hypothetical protein
MGRLGDLIGPVVQPIISTVIGGAAAVLWGLSKNSALLSVLREPLRGYI